MQTLRHDNPGDSDAPASFVDATSPIKVVMAAKKGIRSRRLIGGNGLA